MRAAQLGAPHVRHSQRRLQLASASAASVRFPDSVPPTRIDATVSSDRRERGTSRFDRCGSEPFDAALKLVRSLAAAATLRGPPACCSRGIRTAPRPPRPPARVWRQASGCKVPPRTLQYMLGRGMRRERSCDRAKLLAPAGKVRASLSSPSSLLASSTSALPAPRALPRASSAASCVFGRLALCPVSGAADVERRRLPPVTLLFAARVPMIFSWRAAASAFSGVQPVPTAFSSTRERS
eukprot:5017337-Prymnesium_polylepis.1